MMMDSVFGSSGAKVLKICIGQYIYNNEYFVKNTLSFSQVPIFHQNHPFEKSRLAVRDGFLLNPYEQTVNVAMLWGLKLQDLSSCNRLHYRKPNEKCTGNTIYDTTFDLNDPSAQLDLLVSSVILSDYAETIIIILGRCG